MANHKRKPEILAIGNPIRGLHDKAWIFIDDPLKLTESEEHMKKPSLEDKQLGKGGLKK